MRQLYLPGWIKNLITVPNHAIAFPTTPSSKFASLLIAPFPYSSSFIINFSILLILLLTHTRYIL